MEPCPDNYHLWNRHLAVLSYSHICQACEWQMGCSGEDSPNAPCLGPDNRNTHETSAQLNLSTNVFHPFERGGRGPQTGILQLQNPMMAALRR